MRNCALRGCLIACVVSVAEITIADSNHPIPRPGESGKPPQAEAETSRQHPQYDQTGPEKLPFFIKEAPPKILQKQSEEAPAKESSNSSPEWWTVYLTAVLAAIGIMQTIVFGLQAHRLKQTIEAMEKIGAHQSKDMQASIAVAKESADAAKKSADVAAGYSRPMLFVSEIYFQEGQVRVDGLSLRAKIVVEIKNFGETPAFLRRSCVDIAVGVQEGYLDVLTHKTGEAVDKRGSDILKPARVGDLLQDDAALNEVINWRKILHCYGFVEYSDYLGEMYICRFCKCYSAPDNGYKGGWYDETFWPGEFRKST
jgi:hypothetical protein